MLDLMTVFQKIAVEQCITRKLISLAQVMDVDEEEAASEQLESIPLIYRLQYQKSSAFLTRVTDLLLDNFKQLAEIVFQGQDQTRFSRLECELALLIRVNDAVIAGRLNSSRSEANDLIDGEVISRVFQLMILIAKADPVPSKRPGVTPAVLATPQGHVRNKKVATVGFHNPSEGHVTDRKPLPHPIFSFRWPRG